MTVHFKQICKCGIVDFQCRCPAENKRIDVLPVCNHEWWTDIENELDSEYDVAAYWDKKSRYLEIDLPASRHTLEVSLTNVYGFVISLVIADETGGVLKEIDLYSCVKREDLAETISNIYNSY